MAAQPGFLEYVTAAFNARPFGMFVAPNWVGLAAFGMLGFANPGFWVVGAGLELGYLLLLATNPRFQRTVAAAPAAEARAEWDRRIAQLVGRLSESDRRQYATLAERCHSILTLQIEGTHAVPHGLEAQADSLGRLSWMYLRLLVARRTIQIILEEGHGDGESDLQARLDALERRAAGKHLEEDLRRSLLGQIDILRQRLEQRREARRKLAFVEAELVRIQQQVELIREQAVLSTDPEVLSRRIDEIAATLGGTAQWIRDQQQVYGAMEDLLTEPPPLSVGIETRARESQ
jgi:hypothetical protein